MSAFDPDNLRDVLLKPFVGIGIPRRLTATIAGDLESEAKLDIVAEMMLHSAIASAIVGYDEYVSPLLQRSGQWLDHYFANANEPTTLDEVYYRAAAHFNYGLQKWLTTNSHDAEAFVLFRNYYMQFATQSLSDEDVCLNDSLVRLIGAECYADVVHFPGLDPSNRLESWIKVPKKQWTTAYVFARSHEMKDISSEIAMDTVLRYLRRYMSTDILGSSRFGFVAAWMKVSLWTPGENALDCLKRVYEFMPKVRRPW